MPSDDKKPPEPLVADVARQATGLFKGVDYQVWLTVLAWIDLAEEEIIVIEGAEDFDVVTTAAGLSVQVKALAAPVSLRSESVVNGIRHFWQHKQANKPRAIRFRFVTTADAAIEASNPFGKDVAGLKLWNECAATRNTTTAETIRNFLLNDTSARQQLEASGPPNVAALIEFLKVASPEEILLQLITPVSWEIQMGGVEAAREATRIRLHAYGEQKGLSIQDSDRALSPLFELVAHKAIAEKRSLSREDFRLVFDKATQESLPKAELALLRLMSVQLAQGVPPMAITTANWDTGTIMPPLPTPCCPRALLVGNLTSLLLRNRFLALSGSTGTGKSTLAKLISARSGQRCLWVNCGGQNAPLVGVRLRELAKQVTVENGAVSVIFDSFDFDGPAMYRSLAGAILLVLRIGGCVTVTTQRTLPELFRRELDSPDNSFTSVPALKEGEIDEFCALAGCNDAARRKLWSRIISFQAQGHPQLTHARVSVAARRGWPAINPAELLQTPDDIKEELALARQLLRELDDNQRELLCRLSVGSHPFRRDHAVAVGAIAPSIPFAGDSFDALVGPWIEKRGKEYFRLSPLLSGAGEANWSAERLREMRAAYGRALMQCGNATLLEASEALMQALVVKDDQLAGPILARLMLAPRKHLSTIGSELDWLLYLTDDKPFFAKSRFVSLTLRQVQFRLAAAMEHKNAPTLAEQLDNESRGLVHSELDNLLRHAATVEILLAIKVEVRPGTLLRCWLDAERSANTIPKAEDLARRIERHLPKRFGMRSLGFSQTLFGFILSRRPNSTWLKNFIQAIDELEPLPRDKVLAALRANETRLQTFLDTLWTGELIKVTRDWDDVLQALNHIRAAGIRWKMPELIIAAARGIAAVEDEYLDRSEEALETLKTAATEAGGDGLMLRYQRGTILFRQERYHEAYESWESTLDKWPTDDFESSLQALLAHSNCGTAAGLLGQWENAARVFRRGCDIARKRKQKLERVAFGLDAAYALWRSARYSEAICEFASCLEEIERIASACKQSEELHTIWKLSEQIIRWCAQDAGAPQPTPIPTPRPGACSELRERAEHASLQKYLRGPLGWLWYSLAEAELYAGADAMAYPQLILRRDTPKYPWLQSLIAYLKVRRAFKSRDFDTLVQLIEETAVATATAKANPMEMPASLAPNESPNQVADYTSDVESWATEVFASALITLVATEKDVLGMIESWQKSSANAKSNFDFHALLVQAAQLLASDPISAYRAYSTRPSSRFQQIVSALRMGSDPEGSLGVCFLGLVTLVTDEPLAQGRLDVTEALGLMVRRVWEQRIRFPAEFNAPRVSIPAIKAACESQHEGLQLAAHILLAARTAVSVRALDSSIAQLRELAGT